VPDRLESLSYESALALFVLGVAANHPHYTATVNDLALVANLFN
jgi:hypothetical protein